MHLPQTDNDSTLATGPAESLVTHDGSEQAYKARAQEWINTSSFVAKLLGMDLLTPREVARVANEIIQGLEDAKSDRSSKNYASFRTFKPLSLPIISC